MNEALFVLTVIYVAYVFYAINFDKKTQTVSTSTVAESAESSSLEPIFEKKSPTLLKTEIPKTPISTTAKKPVTTKQTVRKKGLKDPKTGEITTTYSNYRFTKRWIKEALVTEGLLEKVYKNNELNADCEAAIKVAIAQLETIEQYKV
jgi:predicted double-glycine peptidase